MSATPVSPSALVAWRTLVALGIADDPDRVRDALILWCRPSPALSVAEVREILAATYAANAGPAGSDYYPRDDELCQGTGRPWSGVRDNVVD
jgi:hypothetical protein